MYRYLFRTVYSARNRANHVYEACVLPTKCDIAALPVSRVPNGGGINTISTSSIGYHEKNDGILPLQQDGKGNANKDGEPVEKTTLLEGKFEAEDRVIKMPEQEEELVAVKTDKGSATQQKDAIIGQEVEKPKETKSDVVKSGKESLLDLLGAMKVEVTNKRKFKTLKGQQSHDPNIKPKPAAMESTISMFQKATVEASIQSETLNPELVAAASAAASTLPNRSQAESELLKQLRQHEAVTEAQKKGEVNNLGVIIADMKVGKRPNRQNARPANQIRFDDDGRGYTHDRGITAELDGVRRRRNLFSGKRLGIFSPTTDQDGADLATGPTLWDIDFTNQLVLSTNQMPRNGFEEMIQWTREGKLWQYPINNEAGLEEEASVPFHEHVFLEKHLEEGFPSQGPVRHFMELVVAGLAKNPHLTVRQKKEHISWFRDYFQQKEDVLKEADVYLN
ncbi:small ribosomal subunit protein mS31 [Polymixia lowei]